MRFSVLPSNALRPSELVSLAVAAEQHGYHRFLMSDHFLPMDPASRNRMASCWAVLAGAAVRTTTIGLGSLVTPVRYRGLPVLANEVASVDELSGGRVTVGLGAGWQGNEHTALGLELGQLKTRTGELGYCSRALRTLLAGEGLPSHQPLDQYDMPAPGSRGIPRIPILIGGSGHTTTVPLAAAVADQWNTWGVPADYGVLAGYWAEACIAAGRDPDELPRSVQFLVDLPHVSGFSAVPPPLAAALPTVSGDIDDVLDALEHLAMLGCDEFVLPLFAAADSKAALADLVLFAELIADRAVLHRNNLQGK